MGWARVGTFLTDPELTGFFFLLRFWKPVTRMTGGSVELSTRWMKRHGITRTIEGGQVWYGFKGGKYPEFVALGGAMEHVRDTALKFCSGRGLDIGAGKWPLPGAVGIDQGEVENAYNLDRFDDGSRDFVFSSHCLEHLSDWRRALEIWVSKLKPGGTLFLYLPHESMTLWHPGSPWVGDGHVWSPTIEVLVPFLEGLGMEVIDTDPGPDDYFSFRIVARRRRGMDNADGKAGSQ